MDEPNLLFGQVLVNLALATPGQVQEALALQHVTGQRVGEALISLGYVTRENLLNALSEALGLNRARPLSRPPLGDLLVGLKHVTRAHVDAALTRQKENPLKLGEILVAMGACTYKQVYEGLALQARVAASAVGAPPPAVPGKLRVLVVDDSVLACNMVQMGLSDLGYEVITSQDPLQALEEVFRLKPAIVLSDLDMPGIDGAELCRRLKNSPARTVPVIILTASAEDRQKVSGLRAGADDFVNKSASMEELAARIESVVRRTGETEHIRKLFARYTSDAVVEEILKSGGIVLTGEKREATVLFADIRNFTGLAESMPPEQVVAILNEVLGRLSDAVLTCGGTLDKFLGDGLMAVFGAPVRRDDDALRALQAAKMMMESIRERNDAARRAGMPALDLGIGINSGAVVAGNLGSQQRTEYTCIGDSVNVAARLCAAAGPGEILVGQRTRELVHAAEQFEDLPPLRLKGKASPVSLYRAIWWHSA